MNERKKYKWYDPIVDPPIERDHNDYYRTNKSNVIGSVIGGAIGLGMGAAMYNHPEGKKYNLIAHAGSVGGSGLIGAGAGHMIGNVVSNYAMYKDRYNKNQQIHTKEEIKKKMEKNIGPSLSIGRGHI